jgi:hypothetical protein
VRVAVIHDLSDARRSAKTWLPADDRDVTAGRHGAMNRVDPVHRYYRCSEMYCGVGARVITEGE